MIHPPTGPVTAAARRRACASALVLAALLAPAPAGAQMLRGSFDALPGADDDFSPYGMGAPAGSRYEPPPFERRPPSADMADPAGPVEPAGPEAEAVQAAPPLLSEPAEIRRRRPVPDEEDPYEQLGLRAGAFLIKPSVELTGGHDSNPQSDDPPEGSAFWRTRATIDVESDWVRHAFRGRIEAGYRAYNEFPEEDAPEYAADAALRLDVREDVRADFAIRAARDTDTRGDPELVGVTTSDENDRLGATAGVVWKPNRVSVGVTGEIDRRDFGDPDLDDRDYSQFDLRVRTGYELSPALEPFVELAANERVYDLEVNDNGVAHDSKGYRAYAGVRFEPDPVWALEGKVGYGHQEAEEAWIPELDGVVAAGTLIWKPSVLTEIRLDAERDFEASTVECCAIATRWNVGLGIAHEFRRWLILTGSVGYEESFYETMDYTLKNFDAEIELEYKFNRMVSAIGRAAYEKLDSSDNDEDYDATIFEIGLRVQR